MQFGFSLEIMIVQSSPNCTLLKGFLSLVDSLVFRGIVSILRGLFNKSKLTIVCLETYPFYSMINLSSSVILNKHSRFKRTITQRKFLVSLGEITKQKKLNYKT